MNLTKILTHALFGSALLVQAASATTIVQSSGNSLGSVPLGYYAPLATAGDTPTVYAVEWTQASAYQNVDFTAALLTPESGAVVNYTLTDAIGPGTTFAANGIAQGSVNLPYVYGNVDLFQLSSLAAGTYYLILDSPTPNDSWLYGYPLQPSYTTDTGVTFVGNYNAFGASINSAYTASSGFSGVNLPVEFDITGTPVASAPEPATFGALAFGLIGIYALVRRRRFVPGGLIR